MVGNIEITDLVYLELLEKRIVKYWERVNELEKENKSLKQEIDAINHNHELTVKWIKGELDNWRIENSLPYTK